jgi:hypothetical protein
MDNDEAGKSATQQIYNKCNRTYNIKSIDLKEHNDIGSMTVQQIKEQILPLIEGAK